VVYRDGLPVAALTGGKAVMLTELETADQWEAEKRLVRSSARGRLAHLV
jgi:ATP-dependent helicase Lhr and Lhr-like helicase